MIIRVNIPIKATGKKKREKIKASTGFVCVTFILLTLSVIISRNFSLLVDNTQIIADLPIATSRASRGQKMAQNTGNMRNERN